MNTHLHIFDFDGTLVDTPAKTGQNIRKYEQSTGLPWEINKKQALELTRIHKRLIKMRRGWWGRPETLEPPLVPDPTPPELLNQEVADAWHQSKQNPNSITLLMTGRHTGIRNQVLRICSDLKLLDVLTKQTNDPKNYKGKSYQNSDALAQCYFMGDNGPVAKDKWLRIKPHETLPWKQWIIRQFIELHEIDTVELWEDRDMHVKAFEECDQLWGPKFVVHHIR